MFTACLHWWDHLQFPGQSPPPPPPRLQSQPLCLHLLHPLGEQSSYPGQFWAGTRNREDTLIVCAKEHFAKNLQTQHSTFFLGLKL